MRSLLFLAATLGLLAPAAAQDTKEKKQPPKKAEPTLKVGDKAPTLEATKWLQGKEVKSFESGHVYVVEFWATWCGPCIVMMPHMSELQQEYKGKVTFIGYSAKDTRGNTQEKVESFVKQRGPKLGYTFAYDDDRDTYEAWMKAAGQSGIPCCFVVDKAGKIAYIGHPMYLDVVLPKVVAGKWTEADVAAIDKIEEEVNEVFKATRDMDPEAFLNALAAFEKKHPELAGIPYFNGARISSLLRAKKIDEAKKLAEQLIAKGEKTSDDRLLGTVSMALRAPAAGENKELLKMSLKAAEAGVKVAGEKDAIALYYLAEAHFANGDKPKAKETGAQAVAAADGSLKTQLERLTKKYEEDKKEEKKDK